MGPRPGVSSKEASMKTFLSLALIAGALVLVLGVPSQAAKPQPPRFVDNGNGTVTDRQTGLMWEKKTDGNVNATYTWSSTGTAPDGTLFTSFLATMNCEVSADGS